MVMVITIPTAVMLVTINSDPEGGHAGADGGDGDNDDVHETDHEDGDSDHVIMITNIMRLV